MASGVHRESGRDTPADGDGGRWEIAAAPYVSYDSDEGFGYGVIAGLYRYGRDTTDLPYVMNLQPRIELSTEGRRNGTVFFDAPHLLPEGWRITAYGGREHQVATPYFGVGNETSYDPSLDADDGPNPHYYRFGRVRWRGSADIQRTLGDSPLRVLMGAGASRVTLDPIPLDEGTTLLTETAIPLSEGWFNHLRVGLVWDTRDREVGPRRGVWSEALIQRVDEALGSETGFTRWTLVHRQYHPLMDTEDLVFASRVLVQGVSGDPPFHELQVVQSSFREQEGLGGAKTLRGISKNRYTGEGLLLWNAELRWRVVDFRLLRRSFHLVLSAFSDSGRVWAKRIEPDEVLSGLHHGYGGGVRLGMGENFIVGLDVGHSAEASTSVYFGAGYLY